MKNYVFVMLFTVVVGCEPADLPPTTFPTSPMPASELDAYPGDETGLFRNPPNAGVARDIDEQPSVLQLDEVDSFGSVSINRDAGRQPSDVDAKSNSMTLIRPDSSPGESTDTSSSVLGLNGLLLDHAEPGNFPIEPPAVIGD